MPFKDDAANFGGIRSRSADPKLLSNVLLKRVLAIIVLRSARNTSPGGVVAGPQRIASSATADPEPGRGAESRKLLRAGSGRRRADPLTAH